MKNDHIKEIDGKLVHSVYGDAAGILRVSFPDTGGEQKLIVKRQA